MKRIARLISPTGSDLIYHFKNMLSYMSRDARKNRFLGLLTNPTQTGLRNDWIWLEAGNFGCRKQGYWTRQAAKTKALIVFAVIAKLISVFVFIYAKSGFSHDTAHIVSEIPERTYIGMVAMVYIPPIDQVTSRRDLDLKSYRRSGKNLHQGGLFHYKGRSRSVVCY